MKKFRFARLARLFSKKTLPTMSEQTIRAEDAIIGGPPPRAGPIIERDSIPTVEVRGSEHIVSYVNEAFCDLLGKSKAELREKKFADIVPTGAECLRILDHVYKTGDPKSYGQVDGFDLTHAFWLYALWPQRDSAKEPVGVIIQLTMARNLHQDTVTINQSLLEAGLYQHERREAAELLSSQLQDEIAQRRKTEETLREAHQNLRRAHWATERASLAKDNFLATLSHELRTPLTPVLLTASGLATDPALPLEVREQLTMMRRNIELEAHLIDDLLDITRIAHGKLRLSPAVVDLHELIHQTKAIIETDSAAKGVRVDFVIEAARHHAFADAIRMQQVFWNVIRNGVKFSLEGGTVKVRTHNDATGRILIEVEDRGIGIRADALSSVFNAFEQGKLAGRRYGGLGLGLSISQAIVTAHQGTILAESEGEGRGAKFIITLATVDAPPLTAEANLPPCGPSRALRLLIVEDHDSTREVLSRLLSRVGHRITTAATKKDALVAYHADTFDVVISDLALPDGSGLELMREIQRIRPVPGIALTGYGMEEDLRLTSEAGFIAHLVKPVNLENLRFALERINSQA